MTKRAVLKTLQIAVAASTTIAVVAGLAWPGIMAIFVIPVPLLYLTWAIRAAGDHRFSIGLSFMATLVVAVFVSALGVARILSVLDTGGELSADELIPLASPAGEIVLVEAYDQALADAIEAQARVDLRVLTEGSALALIGFSAWLVIALYLAEWKWALGRSSSAQTKGTC